MCYEGCAEKEIVEFCYNCAEHAIDRLPQYFPENVAEESRWIPCTERLPKEEEYILLSFENYTGLDIGRYEKDGENDKFYPGDEYMEPIYQICEKYNKPIVFHCGMSVEPDTLSKYARPVEFEETAYRHPKLRICLAHCGWPWVQETCMLMLKYRNVYADTAFLYFDTAPEFYHKVFEVDMGPHWIDRSFRHQIMFGSDDPRLEMRRMKKAIEAMDIRESTKDLIFGQNAIEFLGLEV